MGPVTVDASVLVRATNQSEVGHEECRRIVELLGQQQFVVILPTLAVVELASGLARRSLARPAIDAVLDRIRRLPLVTFLPVDEGLAEDAAEIAIQTKLRAADSVYTAIAQRYAATLVSADDEQRARVPRGVTAVSPAQFLAQMEGG